MPGHVRDVDVAGHADVVAGCVDVVAGYSAAMNSKPAMFDELNRKIITALVANARTSFAEIEHGDRVVGHRGQAPYSTGSVRPV